MITSVQQLLWLYSAWVALSAGGLWLLGRWSAQQPRGTGVFVVAAIVTTICVASLAYVFMASASAGPPVSPIRVVLNQRLSLLLLVSFLAWPFSVCTAVAQVLTHFSVAPRSARWLSFGCGLILATLSPFALLAAGCGLAGACFKKPL